VEKVERRTSRKRSRDGGVGGMSSRVKKNSDSKVHAAEKESREGTRKERPSISIELC